MRPKLDGWNWTGKTKISQNSDSELLITYELEHYPQEFDPMNIGDQGRKLRALSIYFGSSGLAYIGAH